MPAQLFTPAREATALRAPGRGAGAHAAPSPPAADTCAEFHADAARIARARAHLVPPGTASALAETFRLLGDPTRVRLLGALATGEMCVCDLASLLDHTVSAVSHQLRLLRGVRLVRARRAGRRVFYSLDDHHIIGLLSQARRHAEEDQAPAGRRHLPPGRRP
jgi:DNA-binding transcriptional ArsR family regulator